MVVRFYSESVSPPALIYMGVDKHENEELIRWGWPEDVWFHVDKVGRRVSSDRARQMSSAHVYLRLRAGETLADVPSQLLDECAQLVKANSIQGNKMNNVDVVYTMWQNLHKTAAMDVGQVGFKSDGAVHKVRVEKRLNEVVKRLERSRQQLDIDYRKEREERDRTEREDLKAKARDQRRRDEEATRAKEAERQARSYDLLMKPENMTTNRDGFDEDDFM